MHMQVDMTWSGHVHVYERTCPILYHTCLGYNSEGIPNAPVHMAIGNGGVRSSSRSERTRPSTGSLCRQKTSPHAHDLLIHLPDKVACILKASFAFSSNARRSDSCMLNSRDALDKLD